MKNIGIVTQYTNSYNFGGLLQAKALVRILKENGYNAKQIVIGEKFSNKRNLFKKINEHGLKYAIEILMQRINAIFFENYKSEGDFIETKSKCDEFRLSIDHTEKTDEKDLYKLNSQFDAFVVGSDQVWNPKWINDFYLLNFVSNDIKKIAYSASIARFDFTEFEKQKLYNAIKDYKFISVREKQAELFITKNFNLPCKTLLDPTFLLSSDDWSQEENQVNIDQQYIFVYFLNPTHQKITTALEIAKKYNYILVYPAFWGKCQKYNSEYETFIREVGPREFLYLIKNSKGVITDSYHGTVFSIIYQKSFIHLLRDNNKCSNNMNSRVISLLDVLNLNSDALINTTAFSNIDYKVINKVLNSLRLFSINALLESLSH